MSALRNWLRCLAYGHRYDITNLDLQSLVFCECCNREIFRRTHPPIRKSAPALSDIPLAGGEGQANEGLGEKAHQPLDAASAAKIVEAINSGRLAATRGHAIAWQRKSLGSNSAYNQGKPNSTGPVAMPDFGDSSFLLLGDGGRA